MNYKQMLDKLAELEARVLVLEQEQKKSLDFFRTTPTPRPEPFPVIPQKLPADPWLKESLGSKYTCPVCNLDFRGAMGYACNNSHCPTAVTCQTNPQDGFR